MEQRPACTQSTLSLLRALTHNRWGVAYAALLDPTGEFRQHDTHIARSLPTHLWDIAAELRLSGRVADATRVEQLTADIPGLDLDPALLVVLLCSRNVRKPLSKSRHRLFREEHRADGARKEAESLPWESGRRGRPPLFAEPLGFDEVDLCRHRAMPGPSKIFAVPIGGDASDDEGQDARSPVPVGFKSTALPGCLAGAARFALDQDELWLRSKVKDNTHGGDDGLLHRNSVGREEEFLAWVKRRFIHAEGRADVGTRHSEVSLRRTNRWGMQEGSLQAHIFTRCLTGTDIDAYEGIADVTQVRSLLSTAILENGREVSEETRRALWNRSVYAARRIAGQERFSLLAARTNEISDLTARATLCGQVYQDVLSFAEAYAFADKGRVLDSISNFAFDLSRTFFCALYASAHENRVITRNKPWALLDTAEGFISDMALFAEVASDIEQTTGSACDVLNVVIEAVAQHAGNETIEHLMETAMSPYLQNVWDWFFDGSSARDINKEFFGTVLGPSVTSSESLCTSAQGANLARKSVAQFPDIFDHEQSLFILRAGRSRALLKQFLPDLPILLKRPPDLSMGDELIDIYDLCTELNSFSEEITTPSRWEKNSYSSTATDDAKAADGSLSTRPDSSEIGKQLTADIVGAGGDQLLETCFFLPEYCPNAYYLYNKSSKLFATSMKDNGNDEGAQHSKSENSEQLRPPLRILYGGVMLEPLRKTDVVVQRQVLHYFVNELQVFVHFRNLRSHILLGAGDFANALVEQIDIAASLSEENEKFIQRRANAAMTFYGTSGPGMRSIRDRTHLNRCLVTTLNLCSFDNNPHTACLSLDAIPKSRTGKSSLWDCTMDFKYEIQFPLNMMLSDDVLLMYSKIFDFFLRVLRAKKSLRSLFMLSRRNSVLGRRAQQRALADCRLRATLWQFCWQAEHFVSIFGGFEMDQVLGLAWDNFETSWKTARSIWELRDAHAHYLNDCVRRCLLSEKHKSVLGVMSGGFDIVVKVDRQIVAVCTSDSFISETSTNDTIDLLISSSASLRRRCAFLADVLERLLEGGTHSHLEDLLTRLKFNSYY